MENLQTNSRPYWGGIFPSFSYIFLEPEETIQAVSPEFTVCCCCSWVNLYHLQDHKELLVTVVSISFEVSLSKEAVVCHCCILRGLD